MNAHRCVLLAPWDGRTLCRQATSSHCLWMATCCEELLAIQEPSLPTSCTTASRNTSNRGYTQIRWRPSLVPAAAAAAILRPTSQSTEMPLRRSHQRRRTLHRSSGHPRDRWVRQSQLSVFRFNELRLIRFLPLLFSVSASMDLIPFVKFAFADFPHLCFLFFFLSMLWSFS